MEWEAYFYFRLKGKDDQKWNLALQELLQQTEYWTKYITKNLYNKNFIITDCRY